MNDMEDKFYEAQRKAVDRISMEAIHKNVEWGSCPGVLHIIGVKPNYVERTARPMQEICKQAEEAKDRVWELLRLRAEILLDQDQFTKSHFDFMQEFIQERIDKYNEKNTFTMTYENPNYENDY